MPRPLRANGNHFSSRSCLNLCPALPVGLVIVGSDKRGTIYGIYDLSEQMGVSPWYWWADVTPDHKDGLFVKPGKYCARTAGS